jgi:hypothetical protein
MEKRIPAETREKVVDEMTSNADPKPIVNYTVGMIIVFVVVLLVAIIALGIFFSTGSPGSSSGTNQSERRAEP